MVGSHLIKSWSSTQAVISLSSGEAEFCGVVKASGIGLGYVAFLEDLGCTNPLRVWTESAATIGICGRSNFGKLRHIGTRAFWVQQRVKDSCIELRKIRGEVNPADLFTKRTLTRDRPIGPTELSDLECQGGRAESAPQTRGSTSGRATMAEVMAVDSGHGLDREPIPIMPHRCCSVGQLDELYPPLSAVEAVDDESEERDELLETGVEIARGGVKEASQFGRRRVQRQEFV